MPHAMTDLLEQQTTRINAGECAHPSPTRATPAGPMAGGRPRAEAPPREPVLALVNQIFTRLAALYPRTWESAFPSQNVLSLSKRELAQELAIWTTLPGREVTERAMSELKRQGSTWPPTIPVLVSMLAPQPADYGMPATADAWAEACAHAHEPTRWRWSHEAVRLAGAAVGWWELTHTTAQSQWPRLEKRFAKHYQALVNRVMAGEQLTPRQLLEHDVNRTPADRAERASREAAAKQAEEAGLPHAMNASQGLAALKAATGRA